MEALLGQLRTLGDDGDAAIRGVIHDLVTDTRDFAETGMRASGGGKVYQKYNPRRTHQASAKGAYPAVDTGDFVNRQLVAIYPLPSNLSGMVGTNDPRGYWFEMGNSRMAARPWLLPSFNRAKIGVEKELKRRWEAMV